MSQAVSERIQPLALRAMSGDTAGHLDLVAARLGSGGFELGGGAWQFALEPAAASAPWPAQAFVVTLEWGGAPFRLVSSPALLALLYAHRFPETDLALLPEELALAGFELAWEEVAANLEQLSGRRVRLVSAGHAAEDAAHGEYAFRVMLASERAADGVSGLLLTDAPGLALLAILARRRPAAPAAEPDPQTPVRLRLELGETRLSVAQLRALALHDVIVLDTALDPADAALILRTDARHAVRARLRDHVLTLESALENIPMSAPASPPENATPDESPVSLDEVEIRLSFDLGDKTLTLGELAALQPGQTFTLDAPPARLVAIRANGRLVGRGELVRIDDAAGVRVLELAARDA
ncbi:type III secretion system cytoplasmic ring protein SctQ [Pseudothauera rhizosphaerae]|uniref:YscQ/HrcQ family type III secretion apparatus protein n=1 Tax=Pseudothauera rhizosphaerae TaxID=2565932 RepID=A0A4S4ADV8_9RHOO|nr:type III secretion system cytoplasmic ring protein SctQ [Pseudothauera rhizosphaerae]THF57265.1 YscQ/HrcQ family type III secretion apparatus protein [Pseudothauera rhizosphaerae]